jgi:cell division protein FtsL
MPSWRQIPAPGARSCGPLNAVADAGFLQIPSLGEELKMMTDWSAGVETRNYKIAHRTDSRNLWELLASILCLLMIAGTLVGHLWIRSRIVKMGYAMQQLKDTEESLTRTYNNLTCEEETLKQPQRIDFIARTSLAMEPLQPGQLIPGFRDVEGGGTAAMALAVPEQAKVQPRKASTNY